MLRTRRHGDSPADAERPQSVAQMENSGQHAEKIKNEHEGIVQNICHHLIVNGRSEFGSDAGLSHMPRDEDNEKNTGDPLQNEHPVPESPEFLQVKFRRKGDVDAVNGVEQQRQKDHKDFQKKTKGQVFHKMGRPVESIFTPGCKMVDHQMLDQENAYWDDSQQGVQPPVKKFAVTGHLSPIPPQTENKL